MKWFALNPWESYVWWIMVGFSAGLSVSMMIVAYLISVNKLI